MNKEESPALLEQRRGQSDFEIQYKDTNYFDGISFEAEKLLKLISSKKEYLHRLENNYTRKKVQAEILFLENEILPIVLNETTILFSEITKHLTAKIHEAVNAEADVMVMVIPLTDSPDDTIRIATVNPHRENPIEGIEIGIEAHGRKIEEVQL